MLKVSPDSLVITHTRTAERRPKSEQFAGGTDTNATKANSRFVHRIHRRIRELPLGHVGCTGSSKIRGMASRTFQPPSNWLRTCASWGRGAMSLERCACVWPDQGEDRSPRAERRPSSLPYHGRKEALGRPRRQETAGGECSAGIGFPERTNIGGTARVETTQRDVAAAVSDNNADARRTSFSARGDVGRRVESSHLARRQGQIARDAVAL
jgi:hypothetical protein